MSGNTPSKEIRTLGYVLRRTNYAEADRILNLITPQGKITAIAKGVRKEKSKLAGGIEMFSLTDFNIHQGRSEFGVVTGAKMVRHYGAIVKDLARMELAATILKWVSLAAESSDSPDYFKITDGCLAELNAGGDLSLVEAWFWLNLAKTMGEELNLYRDVVGDKLVAEKKYVWDKMEKAFAENERGEYGANEIKVLRLMVTNELGVARRIKMDDDMMMRILQLTRRLFA